MASKCLIVADMLFDFVSPAGALYCGPQVELIVPRIRQLIDEFRRAGDPIIYLRDQHDPDDREFRLYGRHAVAGSPESRIIPELAPREGDTVVPKKFFSGMRGTVLLDRLREKGCAEIHLTGVCTSICIMETASDLIESDYRVVVHEDAVADLDDEMHRCALSRMRKVLRVQMA